MAQVTRALPFSEESRVVALVETGAAVEARRRALSQKQTSDMELFWEQYVEGDSDILQILCREFEQYTVETITRNPYDYEEFFEREIRKDTWYSSAKGFDAWSVLWSVHVSRKKRVPPKVFWPKDVEEYVERVVPANRVTEVAGLLKLFQVEDMLAMTDGEILQLVILVEQELTFEARFLFRYLQAASRIYPEEACKLKRASSTRRSIDAWQRKLVELLVASPKREGKFWEDVHHFCIGVWQKTSMADDKEVKEFFDKYETLPWHDASVCLRVYKKTMSPLRFYY